MNVTHLSRLANPFGERGGSWFKKKKKTIIKKESTWKVLTFVVYYRIHLNLNLEASARQWPNNLSHHPLCVCGGEGDPTLKPHTQTHTLTHTHTLLRFLSSWTHICLSL